MKVVVPTKTCDLLQKELLLYLQKTESPLSKPLMDVRSLQELLVEYHLLLTNRFNLYHCSNYCPSSPKFNLSLYAKQLFSYISQTLNLLPIRRMRKHLGSNFFLFLESDDCHIFVIADVGGLENIFSMISHKEQPGTTRMD